MIFFLIINYFFFLKNFFFLNFFFLNFFFLNFFFLNFFFLNFFFLKIYLINLHKIFLKLYRPIFSKIRFKKNICLYHISRKKQFKKNFFKNRSRNIHGRLCSSLKRRVPFFSIKTNFNIFNLGMRFVILAIFKLTNSKPFFALVKNQLGITSIVQLADKIFLGFIIRFFYSKSFFLEIRKIGYFLRLNLFKAGDLVCNIYFSYGIQKFWALAAGTCCKVLYKSQCGNFLMLELPSGLKKKISVKYFGILGRLSNTQHKKEKIGSAGLAFILGRRPSVRGIAMNPVDHPHGGRTNTNKPEVSPWGWVTKHKH